MRLRLPQKPGKASKALLWERNIPLVISTIKVTITELFAFFNNMLLLRFGLLKLSFIRWDLSYVQWKDLEWPSKPPTRFIQNVGQCNCVFSWYLTYGSVVYAAILLAITFKLSPLGLFSTIFIYYFKILKWFSMTPARRPATTAQGTMLHLSFHGVWSQFLKLCYVCLNSNYVWQNKQAKCNSSKSWKTQLKQKRVEDVKNRPNQILIL